MAKKAKRVDAQAPPCKVYAPTPSAEHLLSVRTDCRLRRLAEDTCLDCDFLDALPENYIFTNEQLANLEECRQQAYRLIFIAEAIIEEAEGKK